MLYVYTSPCHNADQALQRHTSIWQQTTIMCPNKPSNENKTEWKNDDYLVNKGANMHFISRNACIKDMYATYFYLGDLIHYKLSNKWTNNGFRDSLYVIFVTTWTKLPSGQMTFDTMSSRHHMPADISIFAIQPTYVSTYSH